VNPKSFSFLNVTNFVGHFRLEHDPYSYKEAYDKYILQEKDRIEHDEMKHKKYLEEINALEIQQSIATGVNKEILEKRIKNMKEHDKQHHHSKPLKKPEIFDKQFVNYDGDLESRFENSDSVKFRYGNSGLIEGSFVIKNLIDKNVLTEEVSCNIYF